MLKSTDVSVWGGGGVFLVSHAVGRSNLGYASKHPPTTNWTATAPCEDTIRATTAVKARACTSSAVPLPRNVVLPGQSAQVASKVLFPLSLVVVQKGITRVVDHIDPKLLTLALRTAVPLHL